MTAPRDRFEQPERWWAEGLSVLAWYLAWAIGAAGLFIGLGMYYFGAGACS